MSNTSLEKGKVAKRLETDLPIFSFIIFFYYSWADSFEGALSFILPCLLKCIVLIFSNGSIEWQLNKNIYMKTEQKNIESSFWIIVFNFS